MLADMNMKLFLAMGYSGIDTRELGRASTKEAAEEIITAVKREQVRTDGIVYWPMFWVHESVPFHD